MFVLPDCETRMVHVPTATGVTTNPTTVQTMVVRDTRETGSPEEAVALTVNDPLLKARSESGANETCCVACVTEKLCTI
jgi:hypothetical protein